MKSTTILFVLVASLLLLTLPESGLEFHTISAATLQTPGDATNYRMVQYPLPSGSEGPWSIATDSLGHVWVIEQVSNQLAMFDPTTSTFKEYSIPTPNSTANSVTVDNSGNAWFTELTGNKLGELRNGSTRIIEYEIPGIEYSLGGVSQQLSCGPIGVVAGPGQSIWVLCLFSNQIDEFFPNSSSFDTFNLPVFQSGPAGLVFDHAGNFWFTAADVNMIGHGIVSELQNNTSNGITETAPLNSTYEYSFQHTIDFAGNTQNVKSSLPTPSGIALSPDGNTLWISEHVDSSFDSYNIQTKSLDRYWTSQTNGAFGYPVSFPNGLAVDSKGNVWIAEHYGNKVAEYNPNSGTLTEYTVPCCVSYAAGVYTLALGQNGTVWFVEIQGNAIGELAPESNSVQSIGLNLSANPITVNKSLPTSVTIPIRIQYNFSADQNHSVNLQISGMTATGALSNSTAEFAPPSLTLSGTGSTSDNLTLSLQSVKPGTYYLTLSMLPNQENVTYSAILKLVVGNSSSEYTLLLTYAVIIGVILSILVVGVINLRNNTKRRKARGKRR